MKTLVTGANGFVGSALVRQLIKSGRDIRVMVREQSDQQNLRDLPVEIVYGNLQDKDSLNKAVQGCTRLFHVAADYRLWIPDPDTMYRINVTGTRDLLISAVSAGIEKIVYTSSVAALGLTDDGSPANEQTPVKLEDKIGHYKRSKYLAEQEVLKLVKEKNYPVVIVNPSTPIGPRDIKPTPTGRIILDAMHQRMPAYVDTGLNVVHVDDVASGHILAEEHGKFGECYILGGEDLSLKAILEIVAEEVGINPPRIRLPHNVVMPIAFVSEMIARITGKEPRATIDGVRMAKKNMYFSSAKAERELNYKHGAARQAICDALEWFKEKNY